MILTQLADCASFGLEGLPLPCEEEYYKALEEMVKDAFSSELEVEKVERKLKSGGLYSILKSTTAGKERFSFSNFTEVIKKATREAFFKCEQMLGSGTSHPMWELQFRRILYGRLAYHLAWPLNTQGLRVGVRVIRGEEDNHFNICVTAERWNMTFEEHEPTPAIEATPVWGLSLKGKVLVVDSLEKEAAVVVAEALAGRGEEGLSQLEFPNKLKVVIREFMDKVEKPEDGTMQVDAS